MTTGALFGTTIDGGRKARRGFRGGGIGIGGLAGLVCSYLRATRPLSSLNGLMRGGGRPLERKLLDLWGVMAYMSGTRAMSGKQYELLSMSLWAYDVRSAHGAGAAPGALGRGSIRQLECLWVCLEWWELSFSPSCGREDDVEQDMPLTARAQSSRIRLTGMSLGCPVELLVLSQPSTGLCPLFVVFLMAARRGSREGNRGKQQEETGGSGSPARGAASLIIAR